VVKIMTRRSLAHCTLTFCACLLFGTNAVRADLDAETKDPYKLKIVLHFAPNKNMTEVFRTKVERDVRDSLQAALGDIARVEIVDKHPLLKDVLERGLQYSLDSWKSLDGIKTHFVLIDFVDGQYGISTRQYDGTTGLASPVVRQTQTGDRLLVAREAALLISRDFGLVGTIVGDVNSPTGVQVAIKGGALNAPLEQWIHKGDLFAVAELVGQGRAVQRSYRRPWTLLQVVELPKDGVCLCKPLSRYAWPPPTTAGSQGLRCLKLGTTEGVLKMRLIGDDKQSLPLPGLQVWFGAQSFDSDSAKEKISTDQNGAVQSREVYKNLAYVLVDDGSGERKKIPVEILDDRTVVCVIKIQAGGERVGQFGIRRGSLLRRLDEDRNSVEVLWNQLQKENSLSPQKWLDRANEGLKILQTELIALTAEFDQLQKEHTALSKDPKIVKPDLFDLVTADQMLKGLETRRDKLNESITKMNDRVKNGDFEKLAQQQKKWVDDVRKAESMEEQANYPEALATYERILAEGFTDPDGGLKKRLAETKALWEPKNQQHQQARTFIYEEWPQCTTPKKMQEKMREAKDAFKVCKEAADYLTPRKLFFVNQDHAGQIRKEADELRGNEDREDARSLLETLKALAPELEKFTIEINDYLKEKVKAAGKK
jgi:hypothetical protein